MQLPSVQTLERAERVLMPTLLTLMDAGRKPVNAPARWAIKVIVLRFMALLVLAKKQGRDDIWDWAEGFMDRFGRQRTLRWAAELKPDINNLDQMVQIQDIEDYVFGVTGHWETRGAAHAVKLETECPFADAATHAPEICSRLIHRFESSSYVALNSTYRLQALEGLPLLSKGDVHCRFVHRIDPKGKPS